VVWKIVEPTTAQILDFCSADPIERVFLEEAARRRLGRFLAVEEDGGIAGLCYSGMNLVPSGRGCGALAKPLAGDGVLMIVGEEGAVGELWEAGRRYLPDPWVDRPGQPVYALHAPPEPGETALREARLGDVDLLLPACAAAHAAELGVDPLERDPVGFRRHTEAQILARRSWIWTEDGTILFKAEASAWTPSAVQLQQVWVEPAVRNRGYARRGLADLCRRLLEQVPTVCLFVRRENAPAIALYEAIGMQQVLAYRSILF
jgi:ribosomal protein S18 acetylase RimI-like enzyme